MLPNLPVRSRLVGVLGIALLLLNVVGLSALAPHPAHAQEPAIAGISVTSNGKRYGVRPGAQGASATLVETGQAPPLGSILGPGDTAFWIEEEPIIWNGYGVPAEPQVWRIVRGNRDGSDGQTVLTSATFYTTQPRPEFPFNMAPIGLSLSADQSSIYFDPCTQTIASLSCTAFALDLQTFQTTELGMGSLGHVAVAPDGRRAFVTYQGSCDMGGRSYHTSLITPTGSVTLGTGMPGAIVWLADGRLLFSMIDDWTCDNRAETNRIRLSAANGAKIRDLALDSKAFEVVASPDESYVAYIKGRYNATFDLIGKELWMVGLDGAGLRKLVDLPADAADLRWDVAFPEPDPTGRRPLIVIPGIMGSQLYYIDNNTLGDQIWPGQPLWCTDHIDLARNSGFAFIAFDVIRRHQTDCAPGGFDNTDNAVYEGILESLESWGYDREYQLSDGQGFYPERRTLAGCDRSQSEANLFVFAYDWRQSNSRSAAQLADYIACIQAIHAEGDGVDILAHSMGGLVARRYLIDHPSASVHTLITIGSPWLGAPQTMDILESGLYAPFSTNDWGGNGGLLSPAELRAIVRTFPGAHELLPSMTYFARYPERRFHEDGWDFDGDGDSQGAYSYDQLMTSLDRRYSPFPAGIANQLFHRSAQDDWDSSENPRYVHFVGVQAQDATIQALAAIGERRCKIGDRWQCSTDEILRPTMGRGDGTVPVASAQRLGSGAEILLVEPLAGQGAEAASHNGMLDNDRVRQCIRAILQAENCSTLSGSINGAIMTAATPQPTQMAYYLEVAGAAQVTISDLLGNTTDTISGTLTRPVPSLTRYRLGETADLFVMAADQVYTATVRVADSPIAVSLRLGTGGQTDAALRYRDLNLPADSIAELRFTGAGVELLRVDSDSNGAFETIPPPSANLTGIAAADVDPPVVRIVASGPLMSRIVTLSVSDSGAGVAAILYSLDNRTFTPYTGPIQVDALATPTVYAFADDAAANRSGVVSAQLVNQLWLPLLCLSADC